MRVYTIGIVGHHPERFRSPEEVEQICEDTLALLQYQYDDQDGLRFLLGGEVGAEQWFGNACIKRDADFDLILPFPPDLLSEHWYADQQEDLDYQVENCAGLTILQQYHDDDPELYDLAYEYKIQELVDASDFIVCFWEGRLFGRTFEAIEYAINNSKIVLNALTGLSLVTKEQLQRQ